MNMTYCTSRKALQDSNLNRHEEGPGFVCYSELPDFRPVNRSLKNLVALRTAQPGTFQLAEKDSPKLVYFMC